MQTHVCGLLRNLILMALVSGFSSGATHNEWQLFFPWMATLIHQSLIFEDAGSLRPFSLVASFLAAAVPRVLMLSSMSFIQIHAE